jgi:hypothetical protein
VAIGFISAALLITSHPAWPHGYAGKRIFPTTFEVDDPFVMDEFSLLVSHIKQAGTAEVPGQLGTGVSTDYTARITEHWGVVVGGEFRRVQPDDGDAVFHGFGNLLVGTKYQFFTSDVHETIASIGVDAAVGNTGDQRIGTDPVSVVYPTFFFGKGMGDLPRTANFWRPFAVTGTFGAGFPTERRSIFVAGPDGVPVDTRVTANPTKLILGFTVQYSLQYLQNFVQDVGLDRPFSQMIPVVEFAMESCMNGACAGQTNGTVNPGLIWFGDYFQFGLAAQVPVNARTGAHVGVLALFHLFVDDLLGDHDHDHDH